MSPSQKTITVKVERTIPATPAQLYAGWLNPKMPGTPWKMAQKLLLNPKVDGFFYWLVHDIAHYGRFIKLQKGRRIEHTWLSSQTDGLETFVTITFKKKGSDTVMTLVHTGLPNTARGRGHQGGWNFFVDGFAKQVTKKKKS